MKEIYAPQACLVNPV